MAAMAASALTASLVSCEKDDSFDPVEDVVYESGATLSGRHNDNITLKAGSYTLFTCFLPTSVIRARSSETSCGVKNSPPDFPALLAYIVIRNS